MLRAYGDGNLFGEPYGDGPVRVVWLHGWARRGQDFSQSASELADQGISSVAFDLPGFGSSPLPTVAGGARVYAQMITPALLEIAAEPLVLVGHSFGGTVATVVAATNPDVVRALVLTGAPLIRSSTRSRSPLRYRVVRNLRARGLLSEQRMESARQRFGSADYKNAHGVMRDVLVASVNESYETELGLVRAPVSLLWGSLDREVPTAIAERASSLLNVPNSLRIIEGVGHLLPTEAPHELTTSVVERLR